MRINYKLLVIVVCIVELFLQTLSVARYAYYKILDDNETKAYYATIWVNHDVEYSWWFKESQKITSIFVPFLNWMTKDMSTQHITVEHGIRKTVGNVEDVRVTPRRVFLFGGSTMWGFAANDDETIPSILAKELQNNGAWQITNFGEFGYTSMHGMTRLVMELTRGNIPDVVIFYDGCNDLQSYIPSGVSQSTQYYERIRDTLGDMNQYKDTPLENRSLASKDAVSLLQHFIFTYIKIIRYPILLGNKFLHLVKGNAESSPPSEIVQTDNQKLAVQMVTEYHQKIRILQGLSNEYGFKYKAIWQPLLIDKTPLSPKEELLTQRYTDFSQHIPLWKSAKKMMQQSGIENFMDISTLFDGNSDTIFMSKCHITPQGNRAVASKLKEIILEISR